MNSSTCFRPGAAQDTECESAPGSDLEQEVLAVVGPAVVHHHKVGLQEAPLVAQLDQGGDRVFPWGGGGAQNMNATLILPWLYPDLIPTVN